MINKLLVNSLHAEVGSLKELIEESEHYGDFIGVTQYTKRLNDIELKIKSLDEDPESKKAGISLFFGGKPVLGSLGINADFAGIAISGFQKIVNNLYKNMSSPIYNKKITPPNLMVTDLAKGSFGFVLNEIDSQIEIEESNMQIVLDKVSEIFEASIDDTDDLFLDLISEVDEKTLVSIKAFITHLDKSKASLRIVEGSRDFILQDEMIYLAKQRITLTTISDTTKNLEADIHGILPEDHRFEAFIPGIGTVMGRTTQDVSDWYKRNRRDKALSLINRKSVRMSVRTIRGGKIKDKQFFKLEKINDDTDDFLELTD